MSKQLDCILLIDDDEATNFLSNIILEESNIAKRVITNQTARSAIKYISECIALNRNNLMPLPDLIFLDINMPAMDGWEFLEKFRELEIPIHKKIIIIMLTTSINPDDKTRALILPEIAGFENKPLTIEMIDSILNRFF